MKDGFRLVARRQASRRRQQQLDAAKRAALQTQTTAWGAFAERATELADADRRRRGRE